jgi:hypothetical protein
MFPITISTVERNPADLSARAHRDISRACFSAIGETWQKEILPPRFTPGSPHYPHKPRSAAYLRRKAQLYARGQARYANVDNVLTGNMADILSRPGVVRAFPTRATIQKIGPRYITMRPFASNQPDKWAELIYLKRDEQRRLNREFGETYDRLRKSTNETRHFSTG